MSYFLSLSGSGRKYIPCQFKLLGVDGSYGVLHLQSPDKMSGWEDRPYGSACEKKIDYADYKHLRKLTENKYALVGKSLTGSHTEYTLAGCSLGDNGKLKFQVYTPNYPNNNGATGKYYTFVEA